MKKILLILIVAVLSSCSPYMYSTRSAGKDNTSFVIVLTDGYEYDNVTVDIDGQTFQVEKVYKLKAARKAHPIIITPGKHKIKVLQADNVLVEENIFLGLQETKKVVLR